MKLVSYQHNELDQRYRIGFLEDDYVFDLAKNDQIYKDNILESDQAYLPADAAEFFAEGFAAFKRARVIKQWVLENGEKSACYPLEEVKLGPPNPNPEKVICVGLNYADHIEEMKSERQKHPVLFSKFNNALIGPEDAIEKNPLTQKLDYEVELVVMIGKEARRVKQKDAYQYISGYTIGNDTSARDLQKRTPQWLQGKSLDRSTPIGPWVIPAEEITDPANLNIRSSVNGELRQQSNTSHFIFDIPYLIEFITHLMTLKPGDMIFTGTPEGVAMGMNPQKFLQAGDVITLEIDEIGTLENQVVDQKWEENID